MKTWKQALRDGHWTGQVAGLVSTAALVWRSRRETGSTCAAINAPSHWLWGDPALECDDPCWRYTALGLLVHQGAAVFWGVLYERWFPTASRARPLHADLRSAALATSLAATVDLVLTPRRFTPGFERRLSGRSLWWVYAGFALGVAIGSRAVRAHRAQGKGREAR